MSGLQFGSAVRTRTYAPLVNSFRHRPVGVSLAPIAGPEPLMKMEDLRPNIGTVSKGRERLAWTVNAAGVLIKILLRSVSKPLGSQHDWHGG